METRFFAKRSRLACRAALLFAILCGPLHAQTPEWIWSHPQALEAEPGETAWFRKEFSIGFPAERAELIAAGDDQITLYLNGEEVARSLDWQRPLRVEVTHAMRTGGNLLAAVGKNGAQGPAAIFVQLEIRSPNQFGVFVVSDRSWLSSRSGADGWERIDFKPEGWKPAVSLGKLGVAPWGDVLGAPRATPAESLTLLPGFKAELLRSALPEEGSWVCMTIDHKGRFIISPDPGGLIRLTLDAEGQAGQVERIELPVGGAQGLLYAFESLYVNGKGPDGPAVYRLRDSTGNDQFDQMETLIKFSDGGDHGPHAIVLGPDKMIYVMNGNHTKVPKEISPESPYQNYAEDHLLPQQWDANGHARGILAPGGYLLRTDPDGKHWELLMGGFRNTYDFDFNPEGEMFTFDSDMEWDLGAPWYRPTRINHAVIGGEYGWRSGTGKWPEYYPDSLPGTVDVGLSSPTGVKFGAHSHFPPKYRKALFAADWVFGKIFAVHLEPQGASYSGTFETFLSGKPLAVTDLEFGPDGAMYFIIGGWRTQSGLYRVTYIGDEPAGSAANEKDLAETAAGQETEAAAARALRRKLESFHGKKDPAAIDLAWPHLNSPDRWLRYAARVAIESQDPSLWADRALAEWRPAASIQALLALARTGDRSLQTALLESLEQLAYRPLTESQLLDALRVLQLCFIRMGKPDQEMITDILRILSSRYPAPAQTLNFELSQLLVYLGDPQVIAKTLDLMAKAPTQEEQLHYAFVLRNVQTGWTPEQRRIYFSWFNRALREYRGGASFEQFLINIRNEAAAKLSDAERVELASILEERKPAAAPAAAPRPFVRDWTMAELLPVLDQAGQGRSITSGKEAFAAAQCFQCHRMGSEGGSLGPDLTSAANRFNRRDLLESILLPSNVISDRYQTFSITLMDGQEIDGTITEETDATLVLIVNPMTQERLEIPKTEIQSRLLSKTSTMPEGLLNGLEKEEILDLLAYLESGGEAN
jgi:putative heme-binding domain-containing protein